MVLPGLLDGAFLFSPANTGPLAVNDQVVTIHDMSALDHPEWFSWKFSAWYRFLLPRLATKVRKVVADSEFTKQRICECTGISPDLVVVIPLGVDKRPNTGLVSGVEAQKMAGLPSATYLLTVSSLVPRKNLDGLIEAWKNIEHRLPSDVWLVVAGAVGVRRVFSSVKSFAQCKRVVLVGAVNDETLEVLYRGAVGFVYVSHYEGFGLPLLEAMSYGAPVISSSATAMPEVVGDAALLVDPTDMEAIGYTIQKIVSDTELRRRLRDAGFRRAALFSWDETARKTLDLLRREATTNR